MPGSSTGPIKMTLMGASMVDTVLFQATGESMPSKESGGSGKPRGPVDPKRVEVRKRNANPQMMKMITNFVREMAIPF